MIRDHSFYKKLSKSFDVAVDDNVNVHSNWRPGDIVMYESTDIDVLLLGLVISVDAQYFNDELSRRGHDLCREKYRCQHKLTVMWSMSRHSSRADYSGRVQDMYIRDINSTVITRLRPLT